MLRVRVPGTAEDLRSLYRCRAIPARWMRNLAVQLDELRVIDIGAEPGLDSFQICPMPVAGDLRAVRQPLGEIADKLGRGRAAPIPDAPGRHEFRIGANRNPSPNVAGRLRCGLGEHDIALFGVDKAPNLVELEPLAGQIAKHLVLIGRARLARINQQLVNRVDRNVGEPTGRAKAVAFNETIQDLGALRDRQPVHRSQYNDVCEYGQV